MTLSEFANKFKSKYLWGNFLAMLFVAVLLGVGAKTGIDFYTHHGEAISIPEIRYKKFDDASHILGNLGLIIEVSDTGYVKMLPAGCILEQSPAAGLKVKSGRIIYVTINSAHSPTITIPDVIDNCSLREAMAKLSAMGFKLGTPQYVAGEEDWVYGILVKGKHVVAGDKVSIEAILIIQVGNGLRDAADSVNYVAPVTEEAEEEFIEEGEGAEEDVFEEVPSTEPNETPTEHKIPNETAE